ncbi:MAG: glycosyltransferase [Calditrichia bacterium]
MQSENLLPFSVVIAVKNGADSLPSLIQSLAGQNIDWDKGEVIFALNNCDDESEAIVEEASHQYNYMTYFHEKNIPEGISPKKYALSKALQQAKGDVILQTDADCQLPENWILSHLSIYQRFPETQAVYGLFKYNLPAGIASWFIHTEKLLGFIISVASIVHERAILAFGVNLSYRLPKDRLIQLMKDHWTVLSGDDDLTIQQLSAQGIPIRFCDETESYPTTEIPLSFRSFIRQRLRHLGAGKRYSFFPRIFYTALISSWTLILFLFPFISYGYIGLGIKLVLDIILFGIFAGKYNYMFNLFGLFLLEVVYIPYVWLIGILSRILPTKWK